MKVVSLNLSTLGSGNYAPVDKSNLANCKWLINWKEILGEYYNTNKTCRIKGKLVSAPSSLISTASNLGTVRLSLSSNYSNIVNGLMLGVPIIKQTVDTPSTITQFIGSTAGTVLSVSPYGTGNILQFQGNTGGVASSTLTITSANPPAIPIGSVITANGITTYCTITSQTSATVYTLSAIVNIQVNTWISSVIPNNICLPVGSVITGNGISVNTTITAQTGPYTYTISKAQTVQTIPMIANPNNYYFDLDIQDTNGLSISTPTQNYLNVQFLKTDETTLMSNVPEYTLILNFDFDDND